MKGQQTIGILGGMGPEATSELFNRIIRKTPVKRDQDHINIVIINDPKIPDRTEYILGHGENPIPKLIENLNKLKISGADIALIPCMTAHSFFSELQKKSPIPIVNAIELVESYLSNMPNIERVGLLATRGTYKSRVFQKYLTKEVVVPMEDDQKFLMEIIYGPNGIKAGNTSREQLNKIKKIIERLDGIQAVIAGCTELSLIMNGKYMKLPVIDPLSILAEHAIDLGIE